MKYFVLVLFAVSFIADARQQTTTEENRWAVPNVTYECTARLFQDWARGKKGSTSLKTKPFLMNFRTANDVDLTIKDFELAEDSRGQSISDTDLAASSVMLKIGQAGNSGAFLEIYLSTKPELLNKEIMIEGDDRKDSIVPNLFATTRLWVGDREDIGRNGPITASISCNLKKLF